MLSCDILPMDQLWPTGSMVMKHALHKLSSNCLNFKDLILFLLIADGGENTAVKDSV